MPKPKKLTPQQEHFARLVVRGYSYSAAYRASYKVRTNTLDSSVWVNASKLAADATVAQRIADLTEAAAARAAVTRESMLQEMQVNRDLALDAGDLAVAQSASMGRARVGGLLKDANDAGSKGIHVHITIDAGDKGML